MTEAIPQLPEAAERPTKMIPIGGVEVLVRQLSEMQMIQLAHEIQLFSNKKIPLDRKFKGLSRVYSIIASIVVEEDDRDTIEDLIADGKLDANELVTVIYELGVHQSEGPSQPKVRRGRASQRR